MLSYLLALSIVAFAAAPTSSPGCTDGSMWSGCTTAQLEDTDAVLRGDRGAPDGGESNSRDHGSGSPGRSTTSPPACADCDPWLAPRDDYEVVMVRMSDIARFRPAAAQQRMEPDGWAVNGLPANIYADAHAQIVPGTLLGGPAEVRFTPTAYHWDYGDGSTAASVSPGATWAALGLREFDSAPTSHVFARRGDYTVRLGVVYRAEYRLGGGDFVPIPGTLALPANDIRVNARSAGTVLVDRACSRAPSGPGC